MTQSDGTEFELVMGTDHRIIAVNGPWPTKKGSEFELQGELPHHVEIDDAPTHLVEFAAARGQHVCMYDPDACQTCFCDAEGNMLYCRKMC